MEYKLAQELKDAGFPQKQGYAGDYPETPASEASPTCPTLEELIEACGQGFLNLTRAQDAWEVNAFQFSDGNLYLYTRGATAKEAVSRLWLALNKKPATS